MNKIYVKASELENYLKIDELKKVIAISQGDILSIEDLFEMISDLFYEYHKLEEEFEDYKQYVADNYKERSPYDLYGISERDFH